MQLFNNRKVINLPKRALSYIQREGFISFVKMLYSYIKNRIFLYQEHLIFYKDLNELGELYTPKIEKFTLKIIFTKDELYDLLKQGFSINAPFNIKDFERKLSQQEILFCMFVRKKVVHTSWVVMHDGVKIHPPLNIDYTKEAYIHYCITSPKYRGIGLYPYVLFQIFKFLKEEDKSVAKLTILKDNMPSIKGAIKVGFKTCGKGKFLKVFSLKLWKEKDMM